VNSPQFVVRPFDPARARRVRLFLVMAWLGSLAITAALAAWLVMRHERAQVRGDQPNPEVEALKSRIVVLERSEQVAKAALGELQSTLRDREEEIAGVRADLAFYGRLVGGARREGIAVHALSLQPVPGSQAWNFDVTLTQNFRRGSETRGRLTLSVSGIADDKLVTLAWSDLAGAPESSGIGYAFKYFQQVKGTIMLPAGFEPNRVRALAEGEGGRADQEFPWNEAAKAGETNDVRQ